MSERSLPGLREGERDTGGGGGAGEVSHKRARERTGERDRGCSSFP